MSRTNVHGLPAHLRKDGQGYFLDYFVQENGVSRRKRQRLGQIPLAQAKLILAQNHRAILEQKFMAPEKPKVMFFAAAESFLAYSRSRKKTHYSDELTVGRLKAFFGTVPWTAFRRIWSKVIWFTGGRTPKVEMGLSRAQALTGTWPA